MPITNTTSIDELLKQVSEFETLVNSGLCETLGLNVTEIEEMVAKVKGQVDRFSTAIVKFNPLFRERGWIVSDHSNMDIIETCILLGEKGEFNKAEQTLIELTFISNLPPYLSPMLKKHNQDSSQNE